MLTYMPVSEAMRIAKMTRREMSAAGYSDTDRALEQAAESLACEVERLRTEALRPHRPRLGCAWADLAPKPAP